MPALTGPVLVAATLLVVAGSTKIVRPDATVTALRSVGLTLATRPLVRAGAIAEVLIGAVAIVVGSALADAAVAAFYVGFSAFLVAALGIGRPERAGRTVSCGCTGRADTPPTFGHLVLTVVLALACGGAALLGGNTGLAHLPWTSQAAEAAVTLALSGVGAWLAWAILTRLPEVRALREGTPATARPTDARSTDARTADIQLPADARLLPLA